MMKKIFLSHNYNDKPLVEPIAIALRNEFGEENVFYDSWSIQPGDGIISKMNIGLETSSYVFLFVSQNSLNSKMVNWEWESGLYNELSGKGKLITIRIDNCDMPNILAQKLYIDMYTQGIESTKNKVVAIANDSYTFQPMHEEFSNLSYSLTRLDDSHVEIKIEAARLTEPNPNFAFALMNKKEDISYWIKNAPGIYSKFFENVVELNETTEKANVVIMKPMDSILAPRHSITFEISAKENIKLHLIDVFHDHGNDQWKIVPKK